MNNDAKSLHAYSVSRCLNMHIFMHLELGPPRCSSLGVARVSPIMQKSRKGITDSGNISEKKEKKKNLAFWGLLNERFGSKVTGRF